MIGTGFVWTWLATHKLDEAQLLWFLPVLFALLGWLRSRALIRSIGRTAVYIRKLEAHLCTAPGPCGWETHLAQVHRPIVSRTIDAFWLFLLLVSAAVPFFVVNDLFGS
jgi:hypothetical protein